MTTTYFETEHSRMRCQQRGITPNVVRLILEQADVIRHIGKGARCLHMSRQRLGSLRHELGSSQMIDRAKGVMVIVGDNNSIVTAMHDVGRSGNAYRRQYRNGHRRRQAQRSTHN